MTEQTASTTGIAYAERERKAFPGWLAGQVAGAILNAAEFGLAHETWDEIVEDFRAKNDRQELAFDAPPAFSLANMHRLTHTERAGYRRITGLWMEPADFDRAVLQARALFDSDGSPETIGAMEDAFTKQWVATESSVEQ
jgi:hypothetical protein